MQLAIAARKKDIISRLVITKGLREERENKIEEEKQRMERRAQACTEAKEAFENSAETKEANEAYAEYKAAVDAGNPPELEEGEEPPTLKEFNDRYFLFNWDEENPQIVIPDEVKDDIDNDWKLTPELKTELIDEFIAQR